MSTWLSRLRKFWQNRQSAINEEFARTLPFGDYVVDRWDKARALGFGEGTSVYDSAHIFGRVTVGRNTWVGPFTILDGSGGLTIGDNCTVAAGAQIYSHDTVDWAISGGTAAYTHAPTTIGSNCYIGPNSVIAKGVSIGDGAIIGSNSLVLNDVRAGSKVGGSPAKPLNQSGSS